jgi:hypothetical protein
VIRINENVTFAKERNLPRLKESVSAKSANDAKFMSQFAARFSREISVQLNTSDPGRVCDTPNVVSSRVNEDTDCLKTARYCLNNSPGSLGFNAARTLRVKVEPNHAGAQFGTGRGVFHVCYAADFDLDWSHD